MALGPRGAWNSTFWYNENKCALNTHAQSRFRIIVLDSVLPKAMYSSKIRALEGHRVSSKKPPRVRDVDEGVAGRNVRE